MRKKLPDERDSRTIHFTITNEEGVIDGYLQDKRFGSRSIAGADTADAERLRILVEEVGEVANAMDAEHGHGGDLQVGQRLRGEHEMEIYARQGDLVIEKVSNISGDLTEKTDIVFAGDSSGHRHRLLGKAQMIRLDDNVTRIRLAAPTKLVHEKPDGHKTIDMAVGDYEVRPLRERGDGSDRAVED
jgi:hypothetical protein